MFRMITLGPATHRGDIQQAFRRKLKHCVLSRATNIPEFKCTRIASSKFQAFNYLTIMASIGVQHLLMNNTRRLTNISGNVKLMIVSDIKLSPQNVRVAIDSSVQQNKLLTVATVTSANALFAVGVLKNILRVINTPGKVPICQQSLPRLFNVIQCFHRVPMNSLENDKFT